MMPETLEAMLGGPGRMRFVLQPLVAIILGIRDGRSDAAAGRPPYVVAVLFADEGRREEVVSALRALTTPLLVAVVLDAVLQYVIFSSIRLWQALAVGTTLIALPYVLARGITNRYVQRRSRRARTMPPA